MHTRAHLIHLLTEASGLEHNLLCSYLYAAASLKTAAECPDPALAAAVPGWKNAILGVAVEEMGHLTLINNLLVAVGGSAVFDRPNLPVAPGYHPASVVARLTPFNAATLQHFIHLERPAESGQRDHPDFLPAEEYVRAPIAYGLTPSTPDYETVGAFYDTIRRALVALARRKGADLFVDRDGAGQIGADIVALEGIRPIVDLDSALAAIDTIVAQGEGAPLHGESSHYARFLAIRDEWQRLDLPESVAPAWPAAADPVMRKPAAPAGQRVWITAAKAQKLLDLANAVYGLMLMLLAQAWAPGQGRDRRAACIAAAVSLMQAVTAMGERLARLPAGPQHPGIHAGMTFAVPRAVAARDPAVAGPVLRQRVQELQRSAAAIFPGAAAAFATALAQLRGL